MRTPLQRTAMLRAPNVRKLRGRQASARDAATDWSTATHSCMPIDKTTIQSCNQKSETIDSPCKTHCGV
eukprot:10164754-Alexandrium_andersonii.AAC.1